MDPVMIEKLHAMKRYKSRKNRGILAFFVRLLRLVLALVSLGLFLSCPLWILRLVAFGKAAVLFFAAAPSTLSRDALLGPACLFVLCNVIVVILVGDSKMGGGEKERVVDIYDEYARRVGGRMRSEAPAVAVEKTKVVEEEEEEVEENCEDYGGESVVEEEMEEEDEAVMEGYGAPQEDVSEDEGEEDEGLPADELNRKVEDFIACTQRRWVEESKQGEKVSYRCHRGWADRGAC